MKISTSLNYQRALTNIQNANAEVSKTREQVSTGKLSGASQRRSDQSSDY